MQMIIKDFLYLGRIVDACTPSLLNEFAMTHLINLTHQKIIFDGEYEILHLPLNDSLDENLLEHLHQTNRFIEECRLNSNHRCLVFCKYARSRSIAVLMGYLIGCCHYEFRSSYEYLKNLCPSLSPNRNYLHQLKEYSLIIRKTSSSSSQFLHHQRKEDLSP